MSYQSRQFLVLLWFFLPLFTLGMLLFDMRGQNLSLLPRAIFVLLLVNAFVLSMFGFLRVRLDAQMLSWSFGVLGWPRWRLAVSEIVAAEVCQTQWYEGKGIRFTREGMLYNAAGRAAVRITKKDGSQFRLRSTDSERLCQQICESMTLQISGANLPASVLRG